MKKDNVLRFSTKAETLDFYIDDELYSIPLKLDKEQFKTLGAIAQDDTSMMAGIDWFVDFIAPYLGEKVDLLTDDIITTLSIEWSEMRSKLGITQGEA